LRFCSYKITWNRIENPYANDKYLSQRLEELSLLCYKNPEQAVREIEAEIAKNPDIPILYNNLAATYSTLGKKEKAGQIMRDCYHKFPNYILGKLNYALYMLQGGQADEVPAILGNKYDLKQLYPHRETFHIAEVVAFFSVMCLYHIAKDNFPQADMYWKFLDTLKKHGVSNYNESIINKVRKELILKKGEKVFEHNLAHRRKNIFSKISSAITTVFTNWKNKK
jgi:tetratricopeptide (TPR) repeat protein